MPLLILLVSFVLLHFVVDGACDDCWGRGSLAFYKNSTCMCNCLTSGAQPNVSSAFVRNFASVDVRLMKPTCRYMTTEVTVVQLRMQLGVNNFALSSFFAVLKKELNLKFDDQLVHHHTAGDTEEIVTQFDIREDGTGHNFTVEELQMLPALSRHYTELSDAISLGKSWTRQFGMKSVVQVIPENPPANQVSPVLLSFSSSFPIYFESIVWLFAPVVCILVLLVLEASFGANVVEDEQRSDLKLQRKSTLITNIAGSPRTAAERTPVAGDLPANDMSGVMRPHDGGMSSEIEASPPRTPPNDEKQFVSDFYGAALSDDVPDEQRRPSVRRRSYHTLEM